jgi:class 3 adenylate cyclase
MSKEIGQWLLALGMGQYVDAFVENHITIDDLPDLSDADLKELGVTAMGHRKGILRSVADHASQTDISGTLVAPNASSSDLQKTSTSDNPTSNSGSAERRQLTVMFADLVGSTELSGRLDPEDMRDAITIYQECVAKQVIEIEGHVAKYMGDGILCYFGWPQAHEDDAERAARAALNIISSLALASTPHGEKLEARIGIATGLVVVGDLIGEGASQEEAVIGETPNLAARLQSIAKPGQIVVSDTTRQLLSQSLDVDPLGQKDLKGISRPVDAYAILGEHENSKIAQVHQSGGSTPLIGRETEISLLMDRWNQSVDGEGQVFILSGEPGIGKSQVCASLVNKLEGQEHRILQFQCSPYYSNSAIYPNNG